MIKKNKAINLLSAITMGLLMTLFAPSAIQAATLDVCQSGCTYSTINSAIIAAANNDTITVGPGTYAESQVLVNKPLTIVGSGQGVTIIDGGNATSLPSVGTLRIETKSAGATTVSNLSVINPGKMAGNAIYNHLQIKAIQASTFPTTIKDVELVGANIGNDWGLYAWGSNSVSPEPDLIIDGLKASNTQAGSVLVEDWRGNVTIKNSDIYESTTGKTAIWVGHGLNSPDNNPGTILIEKNTLHGRSITVSPEINAYASGGFSNVIITKNTITDLNNKDTAIIVKSPRSTAPGQSIGSATISENIIIGDGDKTIDDNHVTYGIYVEGDVRNVNILKNEIVGTNKAITFGSSAAGEPQNMLVKDNRLPNNNFGVENRTNTAVSAPGNWWGCSTDPKTSGAPCSPNAEIPGLVNIPNWVVRTLNPPIPSAIAPGQTISFTIEFSKLNNGDDASVTNGTYEPITCTFTAPTEVTEETTFTLCGDAINLIAGDWAGEEFEIIVKPEDSGPPTTTTPPSTGIGNGNNDGTLDTDVKGANQTNGNGGLPFTGASITFLVLVGLCISSTGFILWRKNSPRFNKG